MMKQLQIHCIQHVQFEGPGFIKDWATDKNHAFSTIRLYEHQALPALDDLDFLVVMGGPMSVSDESQYPWLAFEKTFIRSCVESGKAVLGICLGAQLLASAMGAPVIPNQWPEIGWFDLQKTEAGRIHPLLKDFDTSKPVFHWHGDTFGIPAGAKHLLKSEACVNQAFLIGERALGLQFHLEMTPTSLQDIVVSCADDLVEEAPYIQSAEKINSEANLLAYNNKQLADLLEKLTVSMTNQ